MVSQSIRVNFIPSGVQDRLHASQYDTGERVFSFLCFYGSSLYEIPSGAIVTINGQKQGGYAFVLPCTYDGSVVTCDCTQTMTDVAGNVECELQVSSNGETVQSGNFILVVEPSVIDSSSVPSSDYEAIAQMVTEAAGAAEDAQTAAQEAEQAAASIPDPTTLMKYADLTTGTGVTTAGTKGVDATLLNQSNANALLNRSQLQTSGTVATAGQYPLDAVEKNPNVSGSLGAQIADLANRFNFPITTTLNTTVTSLPSSTNYTAVSTITLSKGTYVFFAVVAFSNSATGARSLRLATADTEGALGFLWTDVRNAATSGRTYCRISGALRITNNTTYYLQAYQNSGSSLGVDPRASVVKLSD